MKNLVLLLSLLLTFAGAAQKIELGSDASRGYLVNIGQKAPNFIIKHADDDKKYRLNSLKGKVVLLQFTASWCNVSKTELPLIETDIWQQYKNRSDFALIGIDYKESEEETNKFAQSLNISYPMALDESGDIFHRYASRGAGVTRNVLIDRKGNIIFLSRLFDEVEFGKLKEAIIKALK